MADPRTIGNCANRASRAGGRPAIWEPGGSGGAGGRRPRGGPRVPASPPECPRARRSRAGHGGGHGAGPALRLGREESAFTGRVGEKASNLIRGRTAAGV